MAEGRFLSRSIAVSEQLAAASLEAEAFFYRCIPHLDVEGRIAGSPNKLKAIVAPLVAGGRRDKYPVERIPALLDELEQLDLIQRYEARGIMALSFPGFAKHQRLRKDREAGSKLPAPPCKRVHSGSTPGVVLEDAVRTPHKEGSEGSEVKYSLPRGPGRAAAVERTAGARTIGQILDGEPGSVA